MIISSPAGSGKTEKLARRYISLLNAGSGVEKILAITFTEKAAAEMKQRILDILAREYPELFTAIKAKVPLMRISTIHSFCLKLLKRFSIELGIDPSLSVMDELASQTLWSEAVFEAVEAEKSSPALFFEMMKERGIRGGDAVKGILNALHAKRPQPELILRQGHEISGQEEKRILALYRDCLLRYAGKKRQRHLLDFNDLEILAYDALSRGPEWHNVLYAFDEHTDHLLVDEFQDTSSLQWNIIDKLTEEWRSGMGSKRDAGKTPTIFLVGDEKQSIYQFRGANVSVFAEAKERFSEWLGEDYRFEEVKENYRSLPAIVGFANSLFGRLMPPDLIESWRTRYSPFEAVRKGSGRVELILIEGSSGTKQNRTKEADVLAKTIGSLHSRYEVFEGESKRPSKFSDMAILLRKRTHLGIFENALRKEGIPFIVQKGVGFYDEPETALLREFILFITDPGDDYSLFNLLRSPVFAMDYKALFKLMRAEGPLLGKLRTEKGAEKVVGHIDSWLLRRNGAPLPVLIEQMLVETGGWRHFWERQRHANMKKFISVIESFSSNGRLPLEIREKLIRQRHVSEVSKANINAEEMDAVRIMTVHAAKGLQFPMVFIPSLDEANSPKSSMIAIDDEHGRIAFSYEPKSSKRKGNPLFERLKQKELEEEKRLLYVAVTRAMDYLCMLGALNRDDNKGPQGRLAYLEEAFGICRNPKGPLPFEVLSEADVEDRYGKSAGISLGDAGMFIEEPSYTAPLQYVPERKWRSVTEDLDIRTRHGDDWVVIGIAMHRLFEELSKGILQPLRIMERAEFLLKEEALGTKDRRRILERIAGDFEKLKKSEVLDEVILWRKDAFSELAFNIEKGKTVFKGRIDRLIISGGQASVYDYKTFPVKDGELPELIEKYRFQMEIYKEAAWRIFGLKARAYLVFTHLPAIVEVY